MIECKHRINGSCAVASELAQTTVVAVESACIACTSQKINSQSINRVTCDIACYAVSKAQLPLTAPLIKYLRDRKIEALSRVSSFNRPGLALRKLLLGLVEDRADCGCDEYAAMMDRWGTDGCLARRAEIIDHLNNQTVSFWEMLRIATATKCLTTGQLVDKAIEDSR